MKKSWLLLMIAAGILPSAAAEVRVMSFNLWHGGDAGKQPLSQTVKMIQAAQADIVGLQETAGQEPSKGAGRPDHAGKLAEMLGWHFYDEDTGLRDGGVMFTQITPNAYHSYLLTIHETHPHAPNRSAARFAGHTSRR